MQLSELYTNGDVSTQSYKITSGSGTWTEHCSQKLSTLYNAGLELDKSMFYSMCIDTTYNNVYKVNYTQNINKFTVTSDKVPCEYNATVALLRETSSASVYRPIYENMKFSNAALCVQRPTKNKENYFLFPVIYAIKKSDVTANMSRTVIDTSKIQRITLKELYINKNDYYVISFVAHEIAVSKTSSNKYYDFSTPYIFKGDDKKLYGASLTNIQAHVNGNAINNPFYVTMGFNWHRNEDGSGGGSLFGLIYPTVDSTYNMYANLDYGNIDITFTHDNQTIEKITDTGKWLIVSYANGAILETAGIYLINSDFLLKHIAMYGGFVVWDTINYNQVSLPLLNNSHIAICEMNDEGFTTGDFIYPELKEYYTGINKTGISYNDTFKPNYPMSDKDNIEKMHSRSYGELTGFVKYYKMSREGLDDFIDACQEAGRGNVGFEYMPYINTVMQYPFNVLNYVSAEDHASTITINGVTLDGSYITPVGKHATGKKLTETQLPINNIATTHINRKYNNFLDYAPYTTIEVYIPFCGFVTLPSHCMGKDIQVLLIMDIINGTCKGEVYCDGIIVAEKNGTCGRSVALTGVETGLRNASVISSASGIASSALGLASGIATGNPVSVGYSAVSAIGAISQTMATLNNSYTRTTGNYGDNTNFHDSSCCYLKITRPVCHVPASYGKNVGYICNKTKQLLNCKGYTVVENPELNLNCNYDEETEIKSLLRTGVIIK